MKFKWNKGLLFPYLMLIGSFSINANTVQTENSNHLVLVNNNAIEDKIEKLPANNEQVENTLSTINNQNLINLSVDNSFNSEKNNDFNLNLALLTLSIFLIYLTSSLLKGDFNKINLKALLKLKKHFNYFSYWDFQNYLFSINFHQFKNINIDFLEQEKTNHSSFQVSSIHNITSA